MALVGEMPSVLEKSTALVIVVDESATEVIVLVEDDDGTSTTSWSILVRERHRGHVRFWNQRGG